MSTYYKMLLRDHSILCYRKKKDYPAFSMPNGESFDNDATVLETLWAVEYFPVMFQVVAAKSSFWFFNYLSLFFFHHLHQ